MSINFNKRFPGSDGGDFLSSDYFDGTGLKIKEKEEIIKGFSYGYMANRGDYRSSKGIKSQDLLYELGVNWVCLPIVNYQKNVSSNEVYNKYQNVCERDIVSFVKKAHYNNVKVCLKPMLNSEDYMWRAHIGQTWAKTEDIDFNWDKWFKSYTDFIIYYAELAEELGCEMFCIGCEMLGTEHRSCDWSTLIRRVRGAYSGKLIYNTNHHEEEGSTWFDMLDYIGTSAYYPVGVNGTSKKEMKTEWEKVKRRLDDLSDRKGKKYLFMEIGCRSAKSCSTMPWDFDQTGLPWSEEEQANFYESCIETFAGDPKHFAGVFWWDWSTFIYNTVEEAQQDVGFNIHLKKAETILKDFYKK